MLKYQVVGDAHIVIWQLAKRDDKFKNRVSSIVCYLDLLKLNIRPTT